MFSLLLGEQDCYSFFFKDGAALFHRIFEANNPCIKVNLLHTKNTRSAESNPGPLNEDVFMK